MSLIIDLQLLVCSYLTLNEIIEIFEDPIRDKIIKRYFTPLPSMDDACDDRDLWVMIYLQSLGEKITLETLEIATRCGYFEIVEYICQETDISPTTRTLDFAMVSKQYDIAEYFYDL